MFRKRFTEKPVTQPAQTLFDPEQQDIQRFQREMSRRAPADTRFVIWFTPRSGSSWLTDIAVKSGHLSKPGECFNPGFVPTISKQMNTANMEQYIEMLLRRRNTHGVFGCQLTLYHFNTCFPDPALFQDYFSAAPSFWLIREDIMLQAISLARKQQTKIGHSTAVDAETLARTDKDFVYDPEQINRWLRHLRQAEKDTERFLDRFNHRPLRLSYETITRMQPAAMVNVIAHHIGIPPISAEGLESGHRKIGTDLNAEYAERFKREHRRLIDSIAAERAPMLERLTRDLPDSLPAPYRVA